MPYRVERALATDHDLAAFFDFLLQFKCRKARLANSV